MTTLGERVLAHRRARGWTQEQLCEQSGLHQPFISDLERNKLQWISSDNLLKLARAFGVTMDILQEGEQYEEVWAAGAGLFSARATPVYAAFEHYCKR